MTRSVEGTLAELLDYVRQQTTDGFDLMITNAEAKILLAAIDSPRHHEQCCCDDCINDAVRHHEAALFEQDRAITEQQADEDHAREVGENGVLPWE